MNYLDDDEYLAEILKILKRKFDGGHKAALLMAIRYCCWMRRPLPEWARLAFLQAYDSATGLTLNHGMKFLAPRTQKARIWQKKRSIWQYGR